MARCGHRSCGRWRPDTLVRHGRLGLAFDDKWFCCPTCVEIEARYLIEEARHLAGWVPRNSPPLGRVLIRRRVVSHAVVQNALRAQLESGRRLGEELVAMRAASSQDVVSALAAQAGIGCLASLDPARVASGPGGLSRATVRLLNVVPFDANYELQRLSVACGSPLPGWALSAVREITGWEVKPFLVADELFDQLLEAYGTAPSRPTLSRPIRSVPAAAAAVARAVEDGVARRMHQVRCDTFIWVRLEGHSHAEDLMVSLDDAEEEEAWQAAPTPL